MRHVHRFATHALNALLIIALFGFYGSVKAAQGSVCMPTTGTVSGLTFAQAANAAFAALVSSNSGNSAPSNDCSAAAVKGQVWLDTSAAPNPLKMYDATSWVTMGMLDPSGHAWNPRAGDGTLALPGIAFQSEPASGVRRAGTNDLRIVVNGVDILQINASGATLLAGTFNSVPVGTVVDYCGATEPSGWFFGYGQALNRTTYSALFTAYGTTFGAGNGTTTFNMPDFRGRIIAGRDDMGGSAASRLTATYFGVSAASVGAVGGAESQTLTTAQMAGHTHSFSGTTSGESVNHAHSYTSPTGSANFTTATVNNGTGTVLTFVTGGVVNTSGAATGTDNQDHTHTYSGTTGSTGSGSAHPIVQPTIVCNKIVKY